MKKKANQLLTYIILLLLLPLIVTILYQKMQLETLVTKLPEQAETSRDSEEILLIVANEIAPELPEECIKAQIVLARTNYLAALEKGTELPAAATIEELQTRWGETYRETYDKLLELVKETGNQTLTYEGKCIYAAYHAISAGKTRNIAELYSDAQMPYLSAVDCHEDAGVSGYVGVYYYTEEEFLALCKGKYPDAQVESADGVQITKKDSSNYVLEVQVGTLTDDGEAFRKKLDLKSSCYVIEKIDKDVRIVTYGLGHGLGLSQATAEKMAKEGKNYKEILKYFFAEAELTE